MNFETLEARRLLSVVTYSGRIYLDANLNGQFDPGETLPAISHEQVGRLQLDTDNTAATGVLGYIYPQADGTFSHTIDTTHREYESLELRLDAAWSYFTHSGTSSVTLDPDVSQSNLNFGIRPYRATVSGRVFHDTNANGIWDDGEPPFANFGVENVMFATGTDEDGHYTLDVRPGTNTIIFAAAGALWYQATTGNDLQSITLEENEHRVLEDVGFTALPTRITGTVLIDLNFDGREFGDSGQGGVTVFVDTNRNGVLDDGEISTITDADGGYTLVVPDVADTLYLRAIGPDPYKPLLFHTPVTTKPTQSVTPQNDILLINTDERPTRLSGTVVQDVNFNKKVDPSIDSPLAGITVFLDDNQNGVLDDGERSTITAADGSWSFNFAEHTSARATVVIPEGMLAATPAVSGWNVWTGQQRETHFALGMSIADARTSLPTDMNGDGQPDAIFRDARDGAYYTFGGSGPKNRRLDPPGDGWTFGAAADFDQDGQGDVVWHNDATGQTRIDLIQGDAIKQTIDLPTVSNKDWRLVGAGDFNGDGHYDLLWRRVGDGALSVWHMNGTSLTGFAGLAQVGNTDWQIRGVVDLNYDGSADLLWHNTQTRQVLWWMMDGRHIAGFKTSAVLGRDMRLVGYYRREPYQPLVLMWDQGTWNDRLRDRQRMYTWDLDAVGNVMQTHFAAEYYIGGLPVA